MKEITVERYQAEDGEVFDTAYECKCHERKVAIVGLFNSSTFDAEEIADILIDNSTLIADIFNYEAVR
tara:strand:+ start:68687 stop:68890 length:204 start_codon:yes stop_codon:yes gene_type:complete